MAFKEREVLVIEQFTTTGISAEAQELVERARALRPLPQKNFVWKEE